MEGTLPRTGEASAAPALDAGLLLREAHHRTANEVAAALAAMRLASVSGSPGLLGVAIARLEGFGDLHRILRPRLPAPLDLAKELDSLCCAVVAARHAPHGGRVEIDVPAGMLVEGMVGQRVLLVAAELLANAMRHAVEPIGGDVRVRLNGTATRIFLSVSDAGPGIKPGAATSGTGLGSSIVRELVTGGRGRLRINSRLTGTTVVATFPRGWMPLREAASG